MTLVRGATHGLKGSDRTTHAVTLVYPGQQTSDTLVVMFPCCQETPEGSEVHPCHNVLQRLWKSTQACKTDTV